MIIADKDHVDDFDTKVIDRIWFEKLYSPYKMYLRVLKEYFASIGVELIDFKLEFGKTTDGTIVLADEISPDTCRFWDIKTHEKLDKDRFRRDLGGVEEAYEEMMKRVGLN